MTNEHVRFIHCWWNRALNFKFYRLSRIYLSATNQILSRRFISRKLVSTDLKYRPCKIQEFCSDLFVQERWFRELYRTEPSKSVKITNARRSSLYIVRGSIVPFDIGKYSNDKCYSISQMKLKILKEQETKNILVNRLQFFKFHTLADTHFLKCILYSKFFYSDVKKINIQCSANRLEINTKINHLEEIFFNRI